MSRTASCITLSSSDQSLLEKILRKRSIPEFQKERVQIVLAAASGLQNKKIAPQYNLEVNRVGLWRNRWAAQYQLWLQSDESLRPAMSESLALLWLADKPGRGRKPRITSDQRTKIVALARETPEQNGLPITHWSANYLAEVAVRRGFVDTISRPTVSRILKKTTYRPTEADIGSMQK
jgi:transposase